MRKIPEKSTRIRIRMSRVADGECLQGMEEEEEIELGLGFDEEEEENLWGFEEEEGEGMAKRSWCMLKRKMRKVGLRREVFFFTGPALALCLCMFFSHFSTFSLEPRWW